MNAIVKEEKNMIEPKKEVEESVELIEPKVELIDDMDVKKEEIDEDEYQHMIPYEYRDYIEQHDVEQKYLSENCQKCEKSIRTTRLRNAENHAASHTNIMRFSCLVEECDYKSWFLTNVTRHLKLVHKFVDPTARDVVRMELSPEKEEELRKMMDECFPGVAEKGRIPPFYKHVHNCHICQTSITEATSITTVGRRRHAMMHTDIMLYKCIKSECNFKTKYPASVFRHQHIQHGMITKRMPKKEIELTIEKKLEVERMVIQCFPELKNDSEYRIGMIEKDEDISIEETKEEKELEVNKEDDVQSSGRKRKADEDSFETKKKKKV